MDTLLAGVFGWSGTIGTFTAYVLLARGTVTSGSVAYALLNTVGGLLAGAGAALYQAWPAFASNLVWALLGFLTLVHALRQRHANDDAPADPLPAITRPLEVITMSNRIIRD